jgi:hypothetical protein
VIVEDKEGYRMELRFLRDTDKREEDFVVLPTSSPCSRWSARRASTAMICFDSGSVARARNRYSLATPKSCHEWLAAGAPDVVALAGKRLEAMERESGVRPLDDGHGDGQHPVGELQERTVAKHPQARTLPTPAACRHSDTSASPHARCDGGFRCLQRGLSPNQTAQQTLHTDDHLLALSSTRKGSAIGSILGSAEQ